MLRSTGTLIRRGTDMSQAQVTREQLRQELLADTTRYCCYCGQEQRSFGCCGENHFETFAEMDSRTQEEFLDAEEETE